MALVWTSIAHKYAPNFVWNLVFYHTLRVKLTVPEKAMTLQRYPLSAIQKGIFFDVLHSERAGLHVGQVYVHLKDIDFNCLKKAWVSVVARHEILRSAVNEKLELIIYKEVKYTVKYVDLTKNNNPNKLEEYCQKDKSIGFKVSFPPLVRLQILQLEQNNQMLLFTFYHGILAGESVVLILKELFLIYDALQNKKKFELLRSDSYESYAKTLTINHNKEKEYWQCLLKGINEPTELTLPRKKKQLQIKHAYCLVDLTEQESKIINEFCSQNSLTANMLTQGAWGILLAKYSGKSDIIFGGVRAFPKKMIGNLAGCFINVLPTRINIDLNTAIIEYLQTIRAQNKSLYNYINSDLSEIKKSAGFPGDLPLFRSIIDFKKEHLDSVMSNLLGDVWKDKQLDYSVDTRYELVLEGFYKDQILTYRLHYDVNSYDLHFVKQLCSHFKNIILGLVKNSEAKLSVIECLSDHEKNNILNVWNNASLSEVKDPTLQQIFAQQVAAYPDKAAISCNGEVVSYQDLDKRSTALAFVIKSYINKISVQDKSSKVLIGLYLGRGVDAIVSAIAVIKAGGAFLFLDADLPIARLKEMVVESKIKLLLSHSARTKTLPTSFKNLVEIISIDCLSKSESQVIMEDCSWRLSDLVYAIYTSGSISTPKGVLIKNESLVNTVLDHKQRFDISVNSHILHYANLSFDVAILEIFLGLLSGACVHVVPKDKRSIESLPKFFQSNNITHVFLSAAMLQRLPYFSCDTLRYVIMGGEVCDVETVHRWSQGAKLFNAYGLSEAAICSTIYNYDESIKNPAMIGRPIRNTQVYLLDDALNFVPPGVIGEICIAGLGLAHKYIRDKQLNTTKFFIHPKLNIRMYKTGDCARWLEDGNIQFISRKDRQVKLLGNRIDLGEIEDLILQSGLVEDCHVAIIFPKQIKGANPQKSIVTIKRKILTAYYVNKPSFQNNSSKQENRLRTYLTAKLPYYMVPSVFVRVRYIPMNASDKVDEAALFSMDVCSISNRDYYVAPKTLMEKQLVEVWEHVLKVKDIGLHDDFFKLGGDSIMSLQVVSALRELGIALTAKDIFEQPTIYYLVTKAVTKDMHSKKIGLGHLESNEFRLTPIQSWFFEQKMENYNHFNQTFIFELKHPLDKNTILSIFKQLFAHHDALRLRFRKNKTGIWEQQYSNTPDSYKVAYEQIRTTVDSNKNNGVVFEKAIQKLQSSFDITNGPVTGFAIINDDKNHVYKIIIAFHHLVVDGVSWRILLEDFSLLYQQALSKKSRGELLHKSDSYNDWLQALLKYANTTNLKAQKDFWLNIGEKATPLAVDYENLDLATNDDLVYFIRSIQLDENASIPSNNSLLAAFFFSYCAYSGKSDILLHLERHGRESCIENIDVSRTVGWFTNMFPVHLSLQKFSSESNNKCFKDVSEDIKKQLDAMPDSGIGYGILRHMMDDEEKIKEENLIQCRFNYLGKINVDSAIFKKMEFDLGVLSSCFAKQNKAPHILALDVVVIGSKLHALFSYSKKHYKPETIKMLSGKFVESQKVVKS